MNKRVAHIVIVCLLAFWAQPVFAQDSRLTQAVEFVRSKKSEDALKLYTEIYNDTKISDARRAYGALMIAQILGDAWDLDRSRQVLVEALGKFPAGQSLELDKVLVPLKIRLAVLEVNAGQKDKAVADLEKLLSECKNDADAHVCAMALVNIHTNSGDPRSSMVAGQKVLKLGSAYWKSPLIPIRTNAALLPCDEASDKLINETLVLLYRCESNSDGGQVTELLKACIAQLELLSGNYAEAQYDAFVLTEMASTKASLEDGVKLLAMATKGIDGNMARANLYLAYQNARASLKPGDPAPVNPLKGLKPVISAERLKVFKERVESIKVTNWISHLEKARVLHSMGKSNEALIELDEAYKSCPIDKSSMQRVVDQMADVLVQLSGDPTIGQKVVDYLRFGETGPDNKKGTADDLVDPRAPYMIKK